MSILHFILGLAALLILVSLFLRSQHYDKVMSVALIVKIVAGISVGLVYKYYYPGGDTFVYFEEGQKIANYVIDHPGRTFNAFFQTLEETDLAGSLTYKIQPRALYFSKIVAIIYFFGGGNYWIISAFLSLINFLAITFFVGQLSGYFQNIKFPAQMVFYFLPTFVFWTSGVLKESIAVAAMLACIGIAIKMVTENKQTVVILWVLFFVNAIILWSLKYFYAAVCIPALLTWISYEVFGFKRIAFPVYLILFFGLSVALAGFLHPNLRPGRLVEVIYENYLTGIQSGGLCLQFKGLDGSIASYLRYGPEALFYGLFRPFVWEGNTFFQIFVGFENLVVFCLLAIGIVKYYKNIDLKNNLLTTCIIYVAIVAMAITFSTPNLGTLSRYKVGYWPFFVLLTAIMFINKKAGPQRSPAQ